MFCQIKKQNVAYPAFSKEVKVSKFDVSISNIIPRNDKWMKVNSSWIEVNSYLKDLCESTDILFISNTTINPKKHLNNSQLHLNPKTPTNFVIILFLKVFEGFDLLRNAKRK